MISLEQIRTLEEKVQAAVARIRALSDERAALLAENATLKERLESYEGRVTELQTLVSAFKADQDEIEAGIVSALQHLDELEDAVSEPEEPNEPHAAEVEATSTSQEPSPASDQSAEPDTIEPEEDGSATPEVEEPPVDEAATDTGADTDAETDAGADTETDEDEEPELDIF